MSSNEFCFQCGHQIGIDNRFCDNCGSKIGNENSFNKQSSDNLLIGKIIEIIDINDKITYSEIINLAGKADRADRLVARLENTNNFKILKENNEYFVVKTRSINSNNGKYPKIDKIIISNLENFIKIGPILISTIPGLMGIPEKESSVVVNYLLENKKNIYCIVKEGNNSYISLRT